LDHQSAETTVNVAVRAIRLATDGVHVVTDGDSYFGDRVIVATGAWFPELAPKPDAKAVTVTRQAVFFFEDDVHPRLGWTGFHS